MSEKKWTPGPWRSRLGRVLVGRRVICSSVCAGDELSIGDSVERTHFNANLIAAAPELYEALEDVLSHFRWIAGDCSDALQSEAELLALRRAEAALAKARGEQS